MSFNFSNQADVVRPPEFVAEGTTSTLYGTTPTNPAMLAIGIDSELYIDSDPMGRETRRVGNVDRQAKTKVREKNTLRIMSKIVDSNFWKWATQLPTGAGTPLESRTIADSRRINGTETFRIARGCKVISAVMRIPNDDFITIEVMCEYKTITDTASDFIGSGSHATALTGPPWHHGDGATGPYVYAAVTTLEKGMTINVDWEISRLDSSGDLVDLYQKHALRKVTGSVSVFRKVTTDDADARLLTPRTATKVLKAAVSTITLTGLQYQKTSEGYSGASSDTSIAEYPIECDAISTT